MTMGADMYVGDVDILGDILGARDAETAELLESLGDSGMAQSLVREASAARRIDPRAVMVRQQALARLGYQMAGATATIFAAATATQNVNIQVTRPIRPGAFVVPGSIAPFFVLNSMEVNGRNQNVGAAVSCESFIPNGILSKVRLETINPSAPLVMSLTCIDTAVNRTFRAAIFGASLMR